MPTHFIYARPIIFKKRYRNLISQLDVQKVIIKDLLQTDKQTDRQTEIQRRQPTNFTPHTHTRTRARTLTHKRNHSIWQSQLVFFPKDSKWERCAIQIDPDRCVFSYSGVEHLSLTYTQTPVNKFE